MGVLDILGDGAKSRRSSGYMNASARGGGGGIGWGGDCERVVQTRKVGGGFKRVLIVSDEEQQQVSAVAAQVCVCVCVCVCVPAQVCVCVCVCV
jgi:hypothetical protein